MRSFRIVGAGFSGLTLAYYLKKLDPELSITIVDKNSNVGGLLQTEKTKYGPVEKAANAMLDSEELRSIAKELGVELLEAAPGIKRAYILRSGGFYAWPLSIFESIFFVFKVISGILNKDSLYPDPDLSLEQWGERCLGKKASRYLLAPAIGGIYAAPIDRLNARLIMGRFFAPKKKDLSTSKKPKKKILSVAPREGMNAFVEGLRAYLQKSGVHFEFSQEEKYSNQTKDITVFCGSLGAAQKYLESFSRFFEFFKLKMLSVTTTTLFYEKPLSYNAFGMLYPSVEKRKFLGTLLNAKVFPSRYAKSSETWIKSYSSPSELPEDRALLKDIAEERKELFSEQEAPLKSFFTQWPQGLPLYSHELESFLRETWPSMKEELKASRVYLHGNYLGKLGLSQLLLSSKELANELVKA